MPKKKKLSLGNLSISSFVTTLDNDSQKGIKGGYFTEYNDVCSIEVCSGLCTVTRCGPCNPSTPPQLTVWPCQSVDQLCYDDSQEPCSGLATVCTCPPVC